MYAPKQLLYQEESKDDAANAEFTEPEMRYYSILKEMNTFAENEVVAMAGANIENDIAAVGAGVDGGFTNTHELHVMKYKEVMETKRTLETSSA